MLMFSTFIGPGSIFMVLAGSLNTVFGVTYFPDAMLYNMVPVLLFCLACYYLDSKIQLMMAKVFSVAYVLIMLAVFVGIAIQVSVITFLIYIFNLSLYLKPGCKNHHQSEISILQYNLFN